MTVVMGLLLTVLLLGGLVHCSPTREDAEGERLFRSACGSCHQLPTPTDLPRATWDTIILPRMRGFMADVTPLRTTGYTDAEWVSIRSYLLNNAPDTLPLPDMPVAGVAPFRARFTETFMSPPSTSYVEILPGRGLLAADINKERLWLYDTALVARRELSTGPGITDITTYAGIDYATVLGSFTPTDQLVGSLMRIDKGGVTLLQQGLRRPTSLLAMNIDADAEPEFIVTEYGYLEGALRVYDRRADGGSYASEVLGDQTGAVSVLRESDSTLLVLYAQGNESLVRYTLGPEGFRGRQVLQFPPSYGSVAIHLVDWNGDGRRDLLYVNGDNADYRPVVKPYHGVRIFLAGVDGSYTEELFLPLPGAYDAVATDLDGDGSLELAAISFFPDYRQRDPLAAVVFRKTGASWQRYRLAASSTGRWVCLSAGDLDGDGDTDLVAGSLSMQPVPDRGRLEGWVTNGLPFVVWENRGMGWP